MKITIVTKRTFPWLIVDMTILGGINGPTRDGLSGVVKDVTFSECQ